MRGSRQLALPKNSTGHSTSVIRIIPLLEVAEIRGKEEKGKERLRNPGDPRHAIRVGRVQAKDQRGEKSRQPVFQQSRRGEVDQQRHTNMTKNCAEVPAPRLQSEDQVLQPEPKQENRPVKGAAKDGMLKRPNVGGEVAGQILPRPQPRVPQNLHAVVVDEIEPERIAVGEKDYTQNNRQTHHRCPVA